MKILKNKRFLTHYSHQRRGFTLLEILVVIGLVGIVATSSTGIFIFLLKSDRKVRAILEVKQVGDSAMAAMVNKIRQADTEPTLCASPTSSNTITVFIGGASTTFTCLGTGITSNGDNLTGTNLAIIGFNSCFTCYADPLGSPSVIEISFTLSKTGDVLSQSQLPFITNVSLRTY